MIVGLAQRPSVDYRARVWIAAVSAPTAVVPCGRDGFAALRLAILYGTSEWKHVEPYAREREQTARIGFGTGGEEGFGLTAPFVCCSLRERARAVPERFQPLCYLPFSAVSAP